MRLLRLAAAVAAIASPVLAAEHTVTMAGRTYDPVVLAGRVGDSIRFVNDDAEAHDAFVPTVGFAVDLGKQEPGQQTVLPLAQAGRFEVECVFHPEMLLAVEVAP